MDVPVLQSKTLEGLIEKLRELPVLPAVVVRLMSISPRSDQYFEAVLSLAETDPPFAGMIVRGANSAASSPAEPVVTLRGAVTRLGALKIGELVTSMAVARVFVPHTESQRLLWVHSILVAVIAREIARLRGSEELSPESVYLAGLFHDIGRFVMFDESPVELGAVDEAGWKTPDELIKTEQQIFGFDHAELGWHACDHWAIPQAIAQIVRDHHSFDANGCTADAPPMKQAVACVQMADVIAVICHFHKDILDLDEAGLIELIGEGSADQLWNPPPVPLEMLAPRLHELLIEAEWLVASLGLRPQ